MGALREKMVAEMKLRNFASRTQKLYLAVMVGLPATINSKAAWRCRHQGKAIGTDLNRRPLAIRSSARCHARPGCAMLQSP